MGGVCSDTVLGTLLFMIETLAERRKKASVETDMISIFGNPYSR
jgi:hypothetical protein